MQHDISGDHEIAAVMIGGRTCRLMKGTIRKCLIGAAIRTGHRKCCARSNDFLTRQHGKLFAAGLNRT